MTTTFIDGLAVKLENPFVVGEPMDETAAAMLNVIHHRRIKARLRWMLGRAEISAAELQSKADQLLHMPLASYSTMDDDDDMDTDPIMMEAMSIAREIISARMAKEGLPPPKGLDTHARALVEGLPAIQEQARKRVEAKYQAATSSLGL
jgi:hypothetical protein